MRPKFARLTVAALTTVMLLLPQAASASSYSTINLDASAVSGYANATTDTVTVATFKGDAILVYVGWETGNQLTSVTDTAGNTFNKIVTQSPSNRATAFYLATSAISNNGADVITATQPTASSMGLAVYVLSGVSTTEPVQNYAISSTTATTSVAIPSITTIIANEWLVAGMTLGTNNPTLSAASGWSNLKTMSNGGGIAMGIVSRVQATPGTSSDTAFTFSTTSSATGTAGIALEPQYIPDCPTGTTGTYPSCTSTTGGGTTTTSGPTTDIDIHYIHQLAVKGAAFFMALTTAIAFIVPFRWKGLH